MTSTFVVLNYENESVGEDLHRGMGRPVQALLSFAKLQGSIGECWYSSGYVPVIAKLSSNKRAMPSVLRSSPRFLHPSLFQFLGLGALSFCLRC